ncbi:MAG: hypothetical protein ACREPM_14460 [Gemmatimonadaceae bacterium]
MRIWIFGTVAALAAARDCVAQTVSVMAQAIPVITRADPTATRSALTEGYLSQPVIMAHGAWDWFRGVATLNLEGLTIARGELSTGLYGEGYVDRRHPHTYAHELLAGAQAGAFGVQGSLFAGRGFVPFGSDDPMMRPFEKYPVNHHLAQILERLVAVAALRRGPVIVEGATFNGDEPVSPSAAPQFDRFGDSWAARVTLLPLAGLELSASTAWVKSPEVAAGGGLDQRKASVVARYSAWSNTTWRYAMAEWAHTNEQAGGRVTTRLGTWLGEAAACRDGFVGAARLERADRPEEEPLADPFRTPRPPVDFTNLGVSQWTTLTVSLSPPAVHQWFVVGRPFVEVARAVVGAGDPPGVFDADRRYGANRLWMFSAGVRLRAGASHGRMGRYGVAALAEGMMPMPKGTDSMPGESHMMMMHMSPNPCAL